MERRANEIVLAATGIEGVLGGIASANRNVLRALAGLAEERGARLRVLCLLETAAARPTALPAGAVFEAFDGDRRRFALGLLAAAARDRLFCFDHVRLAVPLLPLSRLGLVRSVIFAHGSEAWKRVRRTSRWAFAAATLCLANSRYTWEKMRATMPGLRGAPCLLGLPPEFDGEEVPVAVREIELAAADGVSRPLGPRMLLTVARLHPGEREKGHDALIEALPALAKLHPEVQLVFAGPGEDRGRVAAHALGAGVGNRVFLPGQLGQGEVRDLYRRCYAYAMPSRQEGFGLVYLEAMSFAKACLGCADQGAAEVIVDGETGLLVGDPTDRDAMLGALDRLLADPERTALWGRKGRERVRERFTAAHHQRRIQDHVRTLLT